MPLGTDAHCKAMTLTLSDGDTRRLEIPPLKADRMTGVELPLGGEKLRKITLDCESDDRLIFSFQLDAFARFAAD